MPSVVECAHLSAAVYDHQRRVTVNPPPNLPPVPSTPIRNRLTGQVDLARMRQRDENREAVRLWRGAPRVWTRGPDWTSEGGFHASLYSIDNEEVVLVFEGTVDSDHGDLYDDVNIATGFMPRQAHHAINVAREVHYQNVYYTGHSLGGALAIIAATHTGRPAVTFNAPYIIPSAVQSIVRARVSEFLSIYRRCYRNRRCLHITIQGDPVSKLAARWIGFTPVPGRSPRQAGRTVTYDAPQCGSDILCRHGVATCVAAVRRKFNYFLPLGL